MGEKIVLGPYATGLQTNVEPFYIQNDAFSSLINAYVFRGRVLRKHGTSFITRLNRFFDSSNALYTSITTTSSSGNLKTTFSLETDSAIYIGSLVLTDTVSGEVFTDQSDGTLTGSLGGTGTINYSSMAYTTTSVNTLNAKFRYYPNLPVLGLTSFQQQTLRNQTYLGFDTKYSYIITDNIPHQSYDVSFYKNPPSAAPYVQKTVSTKTTWNGENYRQYLGVSYENALWVTNTVNNPFDPTKFSMQFQSITNIGSITGGPPASAIITIGTHPLVIGDWVFINEVPETGGSAVTGINHQTGYVTAIAATTITVAFPQATLGGSGGVTTGIVQFLTNRSTTTADCIRFLDGDPTNGNAANPSLTPGSGWVNFAPPLSNLDFNISEIPDDIYYLIGCQIIQPFQDRLLFIGPVVQNSSNVKLYIPDAIVYSQVGTPFYTASFTGDVTLSNTVYTPYLVPTNKTAAANAYFADVTGYGGNVAAGLDDRILSCARDEDVLILGTDKDKQLKIIYTGNDIIPFQFYTISAEYGTNSTFSAIQVEGNVISKSSKGFVITSQTESKRIDLNIPDFVFRTNLSNNGNAKVTAGRDYIKEWIYFSYPAAQFSTTYNNQTLQYNYRDGSWGVFYETFTTYGSFIVRDGRSWATIGQTFPTWNSWNEPWNSGTTTLQQPNVIGGNQQGYVLMRDDSSYEAFSLYIQGLSGNVVTSQNHGLRTGDHVYIENALGTVSTVINNKVFRVETLSANTFTLLSNTAIAGTYLGGGECRRIYNPFIQTKAFPVSWQQFRKTRLGPQLYLLNRTARSKVTLLIYLSQDFNNPYNDGPIVPNSGAANKSLVYSTTLFTCPEGTNLGLSAANANLNMQTANTSSQIWHRVNTSLIGDTVQVAITMSDEQLQEVYDNGEPINAFADIVLHGMILDVTPSMLLA